MRNILRFMKVFRRLLRRLVWTNALILTLAPGLLSCSSADPTDGTWEYDAASSRCDPGPCPEKQTRVYKSDGNTIGMIATGDNGRGYPIRFEYTGAYDGKDYPVTGNPKVETIAQERIDYYTVKTITKREGKVTATSTRVISGDGKTMTVSSQGTDEKGHAFNNTLVLRKL